MIVNYKVIKNNIAIYEKAREEFDVLKKYENGEITRNDLGLFNLSEFGEFYDFMTHEKQTTGCDLVMFITFKELKKKIADSTKNQRFKSLILNMSKPKFIKMISSEPEKFDRLNNGRWISKPKNIRRGLSRGRRDDAKVDGFEINFVALLNWVIINNIDVFETGDITYNKFLNQSYKTKWYVKSLSYDNVPKEELDITNKLISNLLTIVDDSKLNFRKLNSDFITSALASKIKSIMLIPDGTKIKCCKDEFTTYGNRKYLTKGNYYEVKHSYISNGFLKVRVIDDMGMSMTCGFDLFEDIQLKRSNILDQLFGL